MKLLITQYSATPWSIARQAPLSMEFSRQEWCGGLPFPSPGDLPNPGIEPRPPLLHTDSLLSEPPEKSTLLCVPIFFLFPFSPFCFWYSRIIYFINSSVFLLTICKNGSAKEKFFVFFENVSIRPLFSKYSFSVCKN